MIDFKSFEFLGKIYRITFALIGTVETEGELLALWSAVAEATPDNMEVILKFLLHHLSSLSTKKERQKLNDKDLLLVAAEDAVPIPRPIEYEREHLENLQFALRVFLHLSATLPYKLDYANFILRTAQHAELNIASKYVLEKRKLKEILSALHLEVGNKALRLAMESIVR